jgi:hypothetical protein
MDIEGIELASKKVLLSIWRIAMAAILVGVVMGLTIRGDNSAAAADAKTLAQVVGVGIGARHAPGVGAFAGSRRPAQGQHLAHPDGGSDSHLSISAPGLHLGSYRQSRQNTINAHIN